MTGQVVGVKRWRLAGSAMAAVVSMAVADIGDRSAVASAEPAPLPSAITAVDACKPVGISNTSGFDESMASFDASIDDTGNLVAFTSEYPEIAADNNGFRDVYLKDVAAGTVVRISGDYLPNNGDGDNPNNDSFDSALSADGTFVVFTSEASDLVPNDTNGHPDVFRREVATGAVVLVSADSTPTNSDGPNANNPSSAPSVSADGRYVAFASEASDLIANDTNGFEDVFVRDMQAGTTVRVSGDYLPNNADFDNPNHPSYDPAITADGSKVAFTSEANDLVVANEFGTKDVFVRNRTGGPTTDVSYRNTGNFSDQPTISGDGTVVAFSTAADDPDAEPSNEFRDVYLRSLATLVGLRVSGDTFGADTPSLNGNGRYLAFHQLTSTLIIPRPIHSVLVRDSVLDHTWRINSAGGFPAISGNGRYVAYTEFVGSDPFLNPQDVFRIPGPPPNDLFTEPHVLTGAVANAEGCSYSASVESLEPDHGHHSVWFSWTAPESGRVVLSTAGSSFNTKLAAYTGSDLATLAPIASNDDVDGTAQSRVAFNAVAGTAYRIAVGNGDPNEVHGGLLELALDQTPHTLAVGDVVLNEGDGTASMPVSLSSAALEPVTLRVRTTGGTATAGADYTASDTTLIFPPGSTTQAFDVAIVDDALDEMTERIVVRASQPSGASIGDGMGFVTIRDNDSPPDISVADSTANEGDSGTLLLTFTISLSQPSGKQVTAQFATIDGTAVAGEDFTAAAGTVVFPAGTILTTVQVPVNGDTTVEPNERFVVRLTSPANATFADAKGVGTIRNDDP